MAAPLQLEEARFEAGHFIDAVEDDDLVYFCLNVGDADAQVVLLPQDRLGHRRVLIVDAGALNKVPALLDSLEAAGFVDFSDTRPVEYPIAVVVATHPHHDHIAGMRQLLGERFGEMAAEFWEPGFFHTGQSYSNMMTAVGRHAHIVYTQPTSGMQRWFGAVGVTVLAPSIHLRNRFDTYGVDINDSSISLRLEYPATRVAEHPDGQRNYAPNRYAARLVLGADAQTLSWSYVFTDFPYLKASESRIAKAIGAGAGDWNLLSADVLKIAHHGSKHGVSLELVERVRPWCTIVSSTGGGGSYGFPHQVTQEVIREALEATTSGQPRSSDADLGIFYTSDTITDGSDGGSFGLVLRGRRRHIWRFGDSASDPVDLANGRRWARP